MNLILWRHAQAEEKAESDLARLLTAKGHHQAEQAAGWLTEHLSEEHSVWVSEAARSQQTAAHFSRDYTIMSALNPESSAEMPLQLIAEANEDSTIIIVGHQPWIGDLCAYLLNQHWNSETWAIKKGSFWWFKIEQNKHSFQATLKASLPPSLIETKL